MNSTRLGANARQGPDDTIIELRPYQKKIARQRRRAWWAAVLFGFPLDHTARAKPAAVTGAGELVRFRSGVRAARC
jgi:hypothetical protein